VVIEGGPGVQAAIGVIGEPGGEGPMEVTVQWKGVDNRTDWQGILIDANFLVIPALHPLVSYDHM